MELATYAEIVGTALPFLNDYVDANNESIALDSLVQSTGTAARFMAELRERSQLEQHAEYLYQKTSLPRLTAIICKLN